LVWKTNPRSSTPRSSTMRTEGRPAASAVASATGAVSIWRLVARSMALRNSVIGLALDTVVSDR
jgi:hypothetical protein